MKHRHAYLIKQWADDTSLKVEVFNTTFKEWQEVPNPEWSSKNNYRIADPYRELKEAYARGEAIQSRVESGTNWVDHISEPHWNLPVEQYRIKPKTQKVKCCAFKSSTGAICLSIWGSESYANRLDIGMKRIPELDKEVEL